MKLKTIEPKRAHRLAKKWPPRIIQEVKHEYDLISPISLRPFFLPIGQEIVYFSAKEDAKYYYLLYCIYHWKDWSDSKRFGGVIRQKLDTHRHDFEGILRIVDKRTNYIVNVATIFHHEIKIHDRFFGGFNIESEGHGISAKYASPLNVNFLEYTKYKLLNINTPRAQTWLRGIVQREFNKHGVQMPWQWSDWLLEKRFGKRKIAGLIYDDPAKLIKYAEKVGRI